MGELIFYSKFKSFQCFQCLAEVMGELIFYSKIKRFQCFQCLAVVLSYVESLGNFKNKYKIKKEKVRNQTIHNKVQKKKKKKHERETDRPDKEEEDEKRKRKKERETDRPIEKKKKKRFSKKQKKREGDGQTDREEEEKKERRRSSCFTAPPLLRHRLLPFLLLLCFLSLQMMFWPGIHLPAEIVKFRRYNWYGRYFFRYEIRGYLYRCTDRNGIYRLYRPVRYGIDFLETKSD